MLLTPGPTPVPEFVRIAMSQETIHHRTAEFETIFKDMRMLLLEMIGMNEAILFASSGTGAMEACVTNLCHKKALVINAGKFGERFGKICKAFNLPFEELKYNWDTPSNANDILKIIKNNSDIDAVFIQICESAGGLRHPVEQIAKEIKKYNPNISIIADGITALGVEKIDTSNIDALIGGSQKAFMLPPGLSMIGFSNEAIKKIEIKSFGYYFDILNEIKKQKTNTTAYTPATTLIIGLKEILLKMKQVGFDSIYTNTKLRAEATREALKEIGLTIYPKSPACAMSTIYHEKSNEIRKILKDEFDVNIAGGQDHLKGKIFRINHMGFVASYEASWVINAIELALEKLQIRKFDGSANKIFLNKLKG